MSKRAKAVQRLRQEIELSVVWENLYSSRAGTPTGSGGCSALLSTGSAKLDGKSYFSLRMSADYSYLFDNFSGINREIADVFRDGLIEDFHVKRLASSLFGCSRFIEHLFQIVIFFLFSISDRSDSVVIGIDEIRRFLTIPVQSLEYLSHHQV
jgi:hypothetical protein